MKDFYKISSTCPFHICMKVFILILKKLSFNNLNFNSIFITSFQLSLIISPPPRRHQTFSGIYKKRQVPGLIQIFPPSKVGRSPSLLLCSTVKQCLRFVWTKFDFAQLLTISVQTLPDHWSLHKHSKCKGRENIEGRKVQCTGQWWAFEGALGKQCDPF